MNLDFEALELKLASGVLRVASVILAFLIGRWIIGMLMRMFDRMLDRYGVALDYCLKHKAVPLGIAIGLLAISVIWLIRMGVIMLPPMSSDASGTILPSPSGVPAMRGMPRRVWKRDCRP